MSVIASIVDTLVSWVLTRILGSHPGGGKQTKCEALSGAKKDFGESFNVYYLTHRRRDEILAQPIWKHGLETLIVEGRSVRGKRSVDDDPLDACTYTIKGEIRNGKMILTDECDTDPNDFACIVYPNHRPMQRVGIWVGPGTQVGIAAGPIVLTKAVMTEDSLNEAARALQFLDRGTLSPIEEEHTLG